MPEETPHALYLCYFGLRESLVQTQVIPYLKEILKSNIKVSLLTFEPNFKYGWDAEQFEIERKRLAAQGIFWYCLPYHKRPSVPATIYDVFRGARFAVKLAKKEKIDVFHARVHVSALMGAIAKIFSGGRMLFDIRGFLPEEYTDAGVWKKDGLTYRSVKRIERWLLKKSDGFIVLTEKAREILFPESAETGFDKFGRPVEVIPCCIDPKRFDFAETLDRETIRREMNLSRRRVLVYVGSFGGWYLTNDMSRFFGQAHRRNPDTFAMILTQSDVEMVKQKLTSHGLSEKDFLVKKVLPAEVPKYLKAADAAISFIKACYSKQASSPTKIAEYLAAGLPVISNSGVGDLDGLIEGEKVGVIIRGFTENDYAAALIGIDKFLADKNSSEHCRRIAHEKFDLEQVAGKKYGRVYRRLLAEKNPRTLYLCYFGLREPLVQTQVLPYLRQISAGGVKVSLLTFEPNPKQRWTAEQIEAERKKLFDEGIEWHFLTYHKNPSVPATLFDILCGAWFSLKLARKEKIDVLHARTHVPLLMGLLIKSVTKCRLIFDIRGLLAEEYADTGIWQETSVPFRLVKKLERLGLKHSEQVVVLTDKMRDYLVSHNLRKSDSVEVIPCCVDFSRIDLQSPTKKSERFELIYAGSVTGLYMLAEMGKLFLELKKRKPDAFFRILTTSSPDVVSKTFTPLGISSTDFLVQKVPPREVLNFLQKAHLAISFRKPTFSQIAASPTKVPEYLAAGVPVISNRGIGDTDSVIEENKVGIITDNFDETDLAAAVDQSLNLLADAELYNRCRRTALENFDLEKVGGVRYLKVYERINHQNPPTKKV